MDTHTHTYIHTHNTILMMKLINTFVLWVSLRKGDIAVVIVSSLTHHVSTVRIFEVAQKVTPNIAMFVPKNVNIDQVSTGISTAHVTSTTLLLCAQKI